MTILYQPELPPYQPHSATSEELIPLLGKVLARRKDEQRLPYLVCDSDLDFQRAFANYELSHDSGKTWQPFGVEE